VVRRDRVAVGSGSSLSSWRSSLTRDGGSCGEARTRFVAWSLSRRQAEQKPVKGGCEGCFGHLLPDTDAASPSAPLPIRIGIGKPRIGGSIRGCRRRGSSDGGRLGFGPLGAGNGIGGEEGRRRRRERAVGPGH
jgi:hypothetical protein